MHFQSRGHVARYHTAFDSLYDDYHGHILRILSLPRMFLGIDRTVGPQAWATELVIGGPLYRRLERFPSEGREAGSQNEIRLYFCILLLLHGHIQ